MNIGQQLGKMTHDITSGPDLTDMIEIAVMGGVVGGVIGFAKERDRKGALSFALWGAGLGIAGQYMIFHSLKPALRTVGHQMAPVHAVVPRHVAQHYTGAVNRGGYGGNGGMPFGPGPWPTKNAAAPDSNMQSPDQSRLDPNAMMNGAMNGMMDPNAMAAGWW